jgi:hypothetical protein
MLLNKEKIKNMFQIKTVNCNEIHILNKLKEVTQTLV